MSFRALGLAVLLAACTAPGPAAPDGLRIAPGLLNRLDVLAQGLDNEIIVCLTGGHATARALATGFHMPRHRLSAPNRVSAARCPAGTLALWHNHPYPLPVDSFCFLSTRDIRSMRRNDWPFAMVHVRAGIWCWWDRAQIESADTTETLAAVPGQSSWTSGLHHR